MIRDGVDTRPIKGCTSVCAGCNSSCRWQDRDAQLRREGWRPIETAPIARLDMVIRRTGCVFSSSPAWIEGITTHNNIVAARYCADGDYRDRWSNARGNIRYELTHWRPDGRI